MRHVSLPIVLLVSVLWRDRFVMSREFVVGKSLNRCCKDLKIKPLVRKRERERERERERRRRTVFFWTGSSLQLCYGRTG